MVIMTAYPVLAFMLDPRRVNQANPDRPRSEYGDIGRDHTNPNVVNKVPDIDEFTLTSISEFQLINEGDLRNP
jgi:hypothetical protein